jgi:nucleotide-binding universal stress UspA family protein
MKIDFDRILCATDFSDFSNRTLFYGISLANEFNAKLFVCHIVDQPSIAAYSEAYIDPTDQKKDAFNYAKKILDPFFEPHALTWELSIRIGQPTDEILGLAQEKKIDLVIAATHGRSGIKRFIIGSVTERLIRKLKCPLLVVNSLEQGHILDNKNGVPLKKILVGCDFSTDSKRAFQVGLSLAQDFQSELHLVHIIEPPIYSDLVASASVDTEFQDLLQRRLTEKFDHMMPKDAHNWCSVKTSLIDGNPFEELIHYADNHQVDLIVLGIRGHGLVETMLVGSTTDRVIRKAPCPVLCVSPGMAT